MPGMSGPRELFGVALGAFMVYWTLHRETRIDDPIDAGMAAGLIAC